MSRMEKLTKGLLKKGLIELGVGVGDVVMVHTPLEGLDMVNEPDTVIDAFLETIGPKGTLCMPTFTPITVKFLYYDEGQTWIRTSPSASGKITEVMRLRPEARRSFNSTHSVSAIGNKAEEITGEHFGVGVPRPSPWGEWTFGSKSPWQKLYEMDAKYVLLGVDWKENAMFHFVESLFIEPYVLEFAKMPPFPDFDRMIMGEKLEALNLVGKARIGATDAKCMSTKMMVDTSLGLLRENTASFFPKEEKNEFIEWFKQVPLLRRRLRVGAAKILINPPPNLGPAEYVEDIHARALVVEGKETVAIVCSDVGLGRRCVLELRKAIRERTGIPAENIFIGQPHNHHASTPGTITPGTIFNCSENEYAMFLRDKIVEVVVKAFDRRQEARLGFANKEVDGNWFGSRRMMLEDGSVVTLSSRGIPTWFIFKEGKWKGSAVDRETGVLRIENLQGKVIAVLTSFGCHNISRDPRLGTWGGMCPHAGAHGGYFGHAMIELEKAYPGSVAIILAGAVGNVDMWFPNIANPWIREHTHIRYGRLLAAHVNLTLAESGEEMSDQGSVAVRSQLVQVFDRQDSASWILGKQEGKADPEAIPTEVQVIKIGPMTIVGLPGEIYSETSLCIKNKSGKKGVIIASLANDMIGYLPPAERWREGPGYGMPLLQPWKKDLENTLRETALKLVEETEK